MENKLDRFWNEECIGLVDETVVYTQEERDTIRHIEISITFDGERYSVAVQFKRYAKDLVNNYREDSSRLLATERAVRKYNEKNVKLWFDDYDTKRMVMLDD